MRTFLGNGCHGHAPVAGGGLTGREAEGVGATLHRRENLGTHSRQTKRTSRADNQ